MGRLDKLSDRHSIVLKTKGKLSDCGQIAQYGPGGAGLCFNIDAIGIWTLISAREEE
jgi:hypothetical protein